MAGEVMSAYTDLVKTMEYLRGWRDSTEDKRKARAIQKVIEKKLPNEIPDEYYHVCGDFFDRCLKRTRDEFMYIYGLRAQDWRKSYLSIAIRKVGR